MTDRMTLKGSIATQTPDNVLPRPVRGGVSPRMTPSSASCTPYTPAKGPQTYQGDRGRISVASHDANASSDRTPAARSSIALTPSSGSGRKPKPFRRRNVAEVTKAVRLLPSTGHQRATDICDHVVFQQTQEIAVGGPRDGTQICHVNLIIPIFGKLKSFG